MKRFHAALDDPVIVASPGVAGNSPARDAVVRLFGRSGPVGNADGEDRFGGRVKVADVGGDVGAFGGEPVHSIEMTGIDASVDDRFDRRKRVDAGDGADGQADLGGDLLDPGGPLQKGVVLVNSDW